MPARRILIIADYYLPGYRAGGPIRSVANLIDELGDEFEYRILTSDRDLGDQKPFPDIRHAEWMHIGKARVRYLAPAERSLGSWRRLLACTPHDLLYFNSYFSQFTVNTLWLRRFALLPRTPLLLAPRGEFSSGALALKRWKKAPYLALARSAGLHDGIVWHVSTEHEEADIHREFTRQRVKIAQPLSVKVAPDLVARSEADSSVGEPQKARGSLRAVFCSRISPKKNLDFALRVLAGVHGRVEFDIFGPLEDRAYWARCQQIAAALPPNISVRYRGVLSPQEVCATLRRYHVMIFPTRGENFGHVIAEALVGGCPVLLSDQTPWRGLSRFRAGWDLPLSTPAAFIEVIEMLAEMDAAAFGEWSSSARAFAHDYLRRQAQSVIDANRRLFAA